MGKIVIIAMLIIVLVFCIIWVAGVEWDDGPDKFNPHG